MFVGWSLTLCFALEMRSNGRPQQNQSSNERKTNIIGTDIKKGSILKLASPQNQWRDFFFFSTERMHCIQLNSIGRFAVLLLLFFAIEKKKNLKKSHNFELNYFEMRFKCSDLGALIVRLNNRPTDRAIGSFHSIRSIALVAPKKPKI